MLFTFSNLPDESVMRVFYFILTRSFDAFWCDALALSLKNGDRLSDAELTRPREKKKKFFCSHSHTDARVSSFSRTKQISHTQLNIKRRALCRYSSLQREEKEERMMSIGTRCLLMRVAAYECLYLAAV